MRKYIQLLMVSLFFTSFSASSDTAIGKVTIIKVPTNHDLNTFYFKLEPMPQEVTKWFYVRNASGSGAGCVYGGNEKSTDRAYSALLTARSLSENVNVGYCLDSSGYGLVNYVAFEP